MPERPARRAVDPLVRVVLIPVGENRLPRLYHLFGQLLGRGAADSQADAGSQGRIDHRCGEFGQPRSISLPRRDLVNEDRPLDRIGPEPAHVLGQRQVAQVQSHDGQPLLESPVLFGLTRERRPREVPRGRILPRVARAVTILSTSFAEAP